MSICPNINTPEWKTLESGVGKLEAFRDFMETDGEIRTPEVVQAKIDARTTGSLYQIAQKNDEPNVISRNVTENLLKTLAAKFGSDYGWRIAEPDPTASWKGKIEEPSQENGNKPTVVINPALVTLDTPLHEFGHIFLSLLKNNQRLYANLLKTARTRTDFQNEYARIKLEYTPILTKEGLTGQRLELALEEETIVELLGKLAANQLDPDTGLYKFAVKVWEAIKDIFRTMVNENGVVDTMNISPNVTLEQLGNVLAHKELKVTSGTEFKKVQANLINEWEPKLDAKLDIVNRLKSHSENTDDFIKYDNLDGGSFLISKATSDFIQSVTAVRQDGGQSYPSKVIMMAEYLKNKFEAETEQVFAEAFRNTSSDLDAFMRNLEDKYAQWFYAMNGLYDSADLSRKKEMLRQVAGFSQEKLTANAREVRSVVDDINADMEHSQIRYIFTDAGPFLRPTDHERADTIITAMLEGNTPGLNRMFNQANQAFIKARSWNAPENVNEWIDEVKEDLDEIKEKVQKIKSGQLVQFLEEVRTEFDIVIKDPVTGKTEEDRIEVMLGPHGANGVGVAFRSKNWDYTDPTFAYKITPETKIKPGRTEVALLSDYLKDDSDFDRGPGMVNKQGVIVEERGDNVVVASRVKFREFNQMTEEQIYETEDYDLVGDAYYYEVPKSKLVVLSAQNERMQQTMDKVIDALSEVLENQPYDYIYFSPSPGESMIRDKGTMRNRLYNLIAKRLYGKYYAEFKSDDPREPEHKILIPEGFRDGLMLNKTLYQMVDQKAISMPFGDSTENSLLGQAILQDATKNTVDPVSDNHVQAMDLAQQMSNMLNIEYQTITAAEAQALTEQAKNPWKAGDIAFYVGGIVYFVGDNLTMDNVFHEFAHPFVRHIAATNPSLFNSLYSQLKTTDVGIGIINEVKENYDNLGEGSNLFKEEVIVKALTASGMDKLNKLKTQPAFAKVVNNILYAIKQLMRKIFGKKVPVSGLTAATSLDDLANMLVKGDKIQLNKSEISQEDVVAYNKERKDYVDELQSIEGNESQQLINNFYDITTKHINKLLANKEYDALADLLTDADKRGDLQEMKANLQGYQTAVGNMAGKVVEDMEHVRKKSTAFVNSLFRLDIIMEKVLLHVQDIKAEGETQDNLHKAYYYDHLLKHWQAFVDDAKSSLDESGIPPKSELRNLLTQIETSIRQSRADINEMYAAGARDTLYNELLPMQSNIKELYDNTIAGLRKRNAPQARIDKEYKRYHGVTEAEHARMNELEAMSKEGPLSPTQHTELRKLHAMSNMGIAVTPEKIERILKGDMADANFFNSYLEGYLYNTDPVIGGLASYVKSKMTEAMATVQAKQNDFFKDVQQPLKDAGFNPYKIADMGKRMGFLDVVAKREEDGTLTKREVWTFLNPFKNYRFDYDEHKVKVEEAQFEFARTGTDEAKQAMVDAVTDRQSFMRNYFHQQYVPEFYEREALFEKDQIGKDALFMRKEWGERLRALTEPANTATEQLEIADEVDLMWREYRQMRSMYYLDGKPKMGHDLDVAKRIREYHEASLKFYESKPRKGVFQNALKGYEQELIDNGITEDSDQFKAMRQVWLDKNTVKTPKQEWYEWRNKLYKRQSEIYAKLPKSEQELLDESRVMQEIFDLTGGFKDDEGQTKATEMSPRSRAKVKELEEQLEVIRKSSASRNGLTKAQNERFNQLHELRTAGQWTPEFGAELSALYELKEKYGLSKLELRELDNIRMQLQGQSKRQATDYYVDIMNTWLDQLNTSNLATKQIDKSSADWVLENNVINQLLGQNADFDKWFKDNHLLKEKFNMETKQTEPLWVRSTLWSITVPTDPSQYETFDILDETGNVVETIKGKPITKYYTRVVKPEYKNEKIIGVTVDNKMQWLPKTVEQGALDNKYINSDYFNMQQNDPKLFKALELMKKHHLANQEGLNFKGKLYLDYPRYRKSSLETIQNKNLLTIYAQRIKDFFKGAKDDADSGFNDVAEQNLVRMDMFDNEVTDVPIHGLFDIDEQDVSLDITTTMMQYMLSAERQKQLVAISPVARAIQSVVTEGATGNKASKGIDEMNKKGFVNSAIRMYKGAKGDNIRKKAVDNFIEREFEGKRMKGLGADTPWINNTASLLFKRASFSFFALNIPSALKNSYGAKFQAMIEASAGKYMTHTSLQKGNAWAYGAMAELSFGKQLYQKGPKSLMQQQVDLFDPSQGRFEEKIGEGLSRTIAKDVASFSWLYNFRRWVELQATIQIFGGMMYHQKIERTMPDGSKKEVPYMDVWEVKDGKIQLKDGVDPKWGVTYDQDGELQVGKEFIAYKKKVHQVMNNLQGAYASFDQPEAQRYLAFRFISYLRRYFTTMTLNRFGFSGRFGDPQPRLNPGTGDVQMGFYITFLNLAKETILNLGKNLMYMTQEEKRASLKMLTEAGSLLAINVAMGLLFGWDPDDDDKYEKLRQRSGALPFPMTAEDPDRQFNGWGFLENHMLYLMMNVRAENEQFLPLPGYGLDDYSAMLDLKSVAFGPTTDTYLELIDDALNILQGDESAYYKRKVGPYEWQQAEGSKFLAHLGRTVGLTGSSLDAAKGIKGFQSVQARAR